jgi:acetyltransferase-like isoleucine patch superfamily enzyme
MGAFSQFSKKLGGLPNRLYTCRIAHRFAQFGKGSVVGRRACLLVGEKYVRIGEGVTIGSQVQLTAWDRFLDQRFQPEIVIGDGCAIGDGAHITAIDRIELGKNVLTGKYVLITDNAHGEADPALLDIAPNKRPLVSKGPVIIEDNVWIGEKASILSGVRIGRGAIVGANAVVTRDVPAGTMALGVPARIYPMKQQDNGKQ